MRTHTNQLRGNVSWNRLAHIIVLGVLALAIMGCSQFSKEYSLEISNLTGYDIYFIYVSPHDSDSWEEDVLGKSILAAGNKITIPISGYKSPIFDVRLVDEDGDTYTFWNVDVSSRDLVVTLDNLD